MESSPGNSLETSTSDIEVLKKMEDEHCRLQRQFRTIQTDRLHRTMGVHPQFRRQDKLMRTLKKEYINIIKDLKIAKSGAHKKNRKRLEADLKQALMLRINTGMECNERLTLMEQLDGVLQRKNKEMLMLRKLENASRGEMHKRRVQGELRLVSTENKLETAMLRFNTVQWQNKRIREEIEHMLKDRANFNQAWSKMLAALSKGKKFLNDLFESSTVAYNQRDEWCGKLKTIQEKAKVDQMQQVQEMRDLQKSYDHEMKLYYFLAAKGVIRINEKQQKREEEEKIKQEEEIKKQIEEHHQILDDIFDYSGERRINKIIETFESIEQINFSTYVLLTDRCAESVVLEKDLKRIRQMIEDRRDWNEKKQAERDNKIEKLKKELKEKQAKTEKLRNAVEAKNHRLNRTMDDISDIFKMLDCSLEPFQMLLGDKQPSLRGLHLTMQLIADRINELVQIVYYYERYLQKKSGISSTSRLKKYTIHAELPHQWSPLPINILVPATPCPSCVEARWFSRVSDTPEVPFNPEMSLAALASLADEPAYVNSDRVHQLTECRVPRSRAILARRYNAML